MNGDFTRFSPRTNQQTGHSRATQGNVKEKDRLSQAFNILLNYWEIKPSQYEARLQELVLKDARVVSAFVPWAHLETDIYHSLRKFVKAAWAARLGVRLFVMPELGVNYPNAGIPKDLLASIPNLAVDRLGRVIMSHSPPNIFPLPSFSSPEVLKRFGNFLIKVGGVLGEVFAETQDASFCEVVVSNSLFNYYRSHGMPFTEHGDYSAAHVMAFRDFLDREYAPARARASDAGGEAGESSERFKMQLYEGYNRHRFFTHVEKLLREKTDMVFSRKSSACAVRHLDLYNPECDPEAAYQGLLTEIFDFKPSVQRIYESIITGGYRGETIHLGNSGALRRLSDQEKGFLILASLIHAGEVGIVAEELFRLPANFQRKLKAMVAFLESRRLVRQTRVTYVSASKFSMEERSFRMLAGMAPGVLSVAAGIETQNRSFSERLVFVDPKSVIRMIELARLLPVAQTGKVVAIPAPLTDGDPANYTPDALAHLERFRKGRSPLKLNIGVGYEVYDYHLGQVVFYDPRVFWTNEEAPELSRFFQALLGLAEVRSICTVAVTGGKATGLTDTRVQVSSWVSEDDPSHRLLFLINPTGEDLEARLGFSDHVTLTDVPVGAPAGEGSSPLTGKSFEIAVPRFGILSMQIAEAPRSQTDVGRDDEETPRWT